MNIKNIITTTAFVLVFLGVIPNQTSALNIGLQSESEVKINDKIEALIELKMDASEDKKNKNIENEKRSDKNESSSFMRLESNIQSDNKVEIKNEKKFFNWLRHFIKKENKSENQLKINGERVLTATSTANIIWKTDAVAEGYIMYNTDRNLVASSTKVMARTSAGVEHTASLNGLKPDTVYYYIIGSKEAGGTDVEEKIKHFKTKKESFPDNHLLKILFTNSFKIEASSANVIWITNKPTNARLWVSATSTVDTTVTPTLNFSDMSYFHNLEVSNLATSTTYYYVAGGTDESGNTILSSSGSFRTAVR